MTILPLSYYNYRSHDVNGSLKQKLDFKQLHPGPRVY